MSYRSQTRLLLCHCSSHVGQCFVSRLESQGVEKARFDIYGNSLDRNRKRRGTVGRDWTNKWRGSGSGKRVDLEKRGTRVYYFLETKEDGNEGKLSGLCSLGSRALYMGEAWLG